MFITIIMLVAGGGAIFGLVKMKQGFEWGKTVVITCAVLAIILAGYNMKKRMMGDRMSSKEIAQIRAREAAYRKVSGEKLGLELAKKFPGAKAVIIRPLAFSDIDPNAPEIEDMQNTQRLAGLEAGFGDAIEILDVIHPSASEAMLANIEAMKKSYMEQTGEKEMPPDYYMMGMEYGDDMMDVDQFNAFTRTIPSDATMVVMLTNFPYDLEKMALWKKNLTVAGIVTMVSPKMDAAIEAGYISAVVISNPRGDHTSQNLPKDMDERFNRRFLLVTPENVKAVAEANENLFPKAN